MRRRALVVAEREDKPRKVRVKRRGELWGADLTHVLILGFFPVIAAKSRSRALVAA